MNHMILYSPEEAFFYSECTMVRGKMMLQQAQPIDFKNNEAFSFERLKCTKYERRTNCFYVVANKLDSKLGVYLFKMKEHDPFSYEFLINWDSKLEISDCVIETFFNEGKSRFEMVLCYKSMYINTMNIIVLNLSKCNCLMLMRHESFQMWESKLFGFLIDTNTDFMTLSYQGIHIVETCDVDKTVIKDTKGDNRVVEATKGYDFLKLTK